MFTEQQIRNFSNLDYDLYKYIIANQKKVIYMRIRDLAKETHVSTTSILRFCQKLGFDGFSEFKIKLRLYLEGSENSNVLNEKSSLNEFLERTLNQNFDEKIIDIATVIAQSENIIFIGNGTSGILAEFGSRYFSGLKKFSFHINDPFFPIDNATFENETVIVLSVSGESKPIIHFTNRVKEKGNTVISITNRSDCTLAQLSDYNLSYFVTEEHINTSNLTTQVPVIYFLESLAKATYKIMKE